MNICKNKSIRKGFIFSKKILPSVGGVFLITQMGCSWVQNKLGIVEDKDDSVQNCKISKKLQKNEMGWITLHEDKIRPHLTNGTLVYSDALKLVIFIEKLPNNGNPPVYPAGDPKEGQKIVDWQGNSINYNGFFFVNPTDKCGQFVKGDGTGVLIINQPTQEQVKAIKVKLKELKLSSNNLSIEQLAKLIEYFSKIDINDYYNSDIEYLDKRYKKIHEHTIDTYPFCGLYRRNDQQNNQACSAIY